MRRSYSSWIHTDPELRPKPWRRPRPPRALGGAWTVMSAACMRDLLSQVLTSFAVTNHCWWSCLPPCSNSQKSELWFLYFFFLSTPPPYLLSGPVHRSLTRCCTVLKNGSESCEGAPVWLCCIKSFFNVFQHFTTSQIGQNHFNHFQTSPPPLHYQMLLC